jgi:hypothetical protein
MDGVLFDKDKTHLILYPPGKEETNYTIPDDVTHISNSAFENCKNLTSVTIGHSVYSIGYNVFRNCTDLQRVYYPKERPYVSGNIYEGTPETLISYYTPEYQLAWDPTGLQDMWQDRITSNGDGIKYAYNADGTASVKCIGFTEKTDIVIPNFVEKDGISYTVTSIPNNAFRFSDIPTSITIPSSIISIGINAFYHCSNLKNINVLPDNPVYSSLDGVLFNKDQTTLIKYPPGKEGEYVIPETVQHFEYKAFSECKSSIRLVIPEGTEIIEPNAFYKIKGLQSIQLPSTLKVIGEDAFFGCVDLTEISIPDSVISIGAGAFANCRSLEQIDIPPYVEEIGDSAFYRCEKLRFAYIPDSLAEVGAYMFNYCHSLESVIIGASVKEIQAGAFLNCENLNAVYFLGDHPEMDQEAFLISNYFKIIRDSQNPRLDPMTNPEVYLDALRGNTPVLYYLSDKLGWYSLSREEAINVIRNCGSWANLGNALDCCLNYTELEPNADDFDYSEGTILSYKGNSPVVVVPDSINGTAVTQIGANAFANSVGVFIIIIPG